MMLSLRLRALSPSCSPQSTTVLCVGLRDGDAGARTSGTKASEHTQSQRSTGHTLLLSLTIIFIALPMLIFPIAAFCPAGISGLNKICLRDRQGSGSLGQGVKEKARHTHLGVP